MTRIPPTGPRTIGRGLDVDLETALLSSRQARGEGVGGGGYRRFVGYREFPAPPPLRSLVECGWSAGVAADDAPQVADVLPDACMDLLWTGAELLVAGPDTAPHPYRREPGTTATGLRFAPGRLPALLGVPAVEVRNRRVPLAEFHPGLARRATGQLADGFAPALLLGELATALPGPPPDPGVRAVAAHVGAAHPGIAASAAATAEALGWTPRTLHRRCLDAFGYGPAVLRRVLRFRHAVALLHAGVPTAEVAARAGYADQPHLSREVRALAGVAPGQLASGANRSTPVPSGSRTVA